MPSTGRARATGTKTDTSRGIRIVAWESDGGVTDAMDERAWEVMGRVRRKATDNRVEATDETTSKDQTCAVVVVRVGSHSSTCAPRTTIIIATRTKIRTRTIWVATTTTTM